MIDLNWLLVLSGTLLPMLTALVTNRLASGGVKAVTLAALAAVAGIANELYSAGGDTVLFDWSGSLANAVTVFLLAVGLHYGLTKPLGVTGTNGAIARGVTGGVGSDRRDAEKPLTVNGQ